MDLEFIMYRILCGFVEYGDKKIYDPLYKTKYKGRKVYKRTLEDCFDVLTDDDAYILLVETNQWDPEKETKLKDLPFAIENKKIEFFNSFSSVNLRKSLALGLEYDKELFIKLTTDRNQYFSMTAKGIATSAMWFEMIKYMYQGTDLLSALNHYQSNMIREETIRNIALSPEWRSYSNCHKNIFGKAPIKLTEDQRRLYHWSNIYSSVSNHHECPDDKVIQNHDAFDGWMLNEHRKDRTKKKIDTKFSGRKLREDAKSVFVFANSKEDIQDVYSMNDANGMAKIKSMEKQIHAEKRVADKNFKYRKYMK